MELSLAGAFLLGACLICVSGSRNRGLAVVLSLFAIMVMLPSCGGGSGGTNGGGGGSGNNNPVPSITSLNPSQVAAGSQVISSVTVNGTNFMSTSTLTLGGVVTGWYVSPSQMQFSPASNQVAATGQFPVVVTNPSPGGGSSNSMNFVVTTGTPTGDFNVTITANGGAFTRTTTFYMQLR